ncbi:hypothetical protein C7S18_20505 [Ahniella affigens]|uniref:Protein kinase domain-containing protein n=1 Tax=Ahniella affigens TaxID=2021234 RepID=A0A2P1PX44_9GAMM|nr:serine/threonine-protein kinase [Ahniella affigens]AVP99405.1 hypothetical protein C7S18_20505 [Ahniella affigens]
MASRAASDQIGAVLKQLLELPASQRSAAFAGMALDPSVRALVQIALQSSPDLSETEPALRSGLPHRARTLERGDILGVWRIERDLGKGGMGSVFEVCRIDGHFKQRGALKWLTGLPGPEAREYFARERQVLADLSHPNIARLLDGGATADGDPYLVMELIEGQHIDVWCHQHRPDPKRLLNLFCMVAEAVAFAHRQLVLHCDLKPSNILITEPLRPVLLDFGIARLLDQADRRDQETPAPHAFSPGYASPEHQAGRVSTQSDVYSLGVILGELLHASGHSNPELHCIVDRATQDEPQRRYGSVDALIDDLHRYQQHLPIRAWPPDHLYRTQKWLRRNWLSAGLSAAAILGLGLGTVLAFSGFRQAERDRDLALAAQSRAEQERAAAQAVADFMVEDLLLSADVNTRGRDARDVTVLDAMAAGLANIESRFAGHPETEGRVRFAIGTVYKHLNRMAEAEQQHSQALALLQNSLGESHELSLEALNGLAGIYLRTGDFDLAKRDYDQGHALAMKAFGPDAPITLNFAGQRVVIAFLTQDLSFGIPFAEQLLQNPILAEGATEAVRGMQIRHNYGRLLAVRGDLDAAEAIFQNAWRFRRQHFGPDALNTLEAEASLSESLLRRGQFGEAEARYRDLLARYEHVTGREHAAVATMLQNLGRALAAQGKHADAMNHYREALEITDRLFGKGKILSGQIQLRIAQSQLAQGDVANAISQFLGAEAILAKQFPMTHEHRQELAVGLADAYRRSGRESDAQALEHRLSKP